MSDEFYRWFNNQRDKLKEHASLIKNEADKQNCLRLLNELSNACKSRRHSLPVHDQKTYNEELDNLAGLILQNSSQLSFQDNMPLFSFTESHNERAAAEVPGLSIASAVDQNITEQNETRHKKETEEEEQRNEDGKDNENKEVYTIRGEKDKQLVVCNGELPNLKLEGLTNCLIISGSITTADTMTTNKTLTSVKIDNIYKCIIYIQQINGPIYLSNINESVIITNCHQFRMHNSSKCHIYLGCQSLKPIIEDCKQLCFAQYPKELESPAQPVVEWATVVDFNWLSKKPSTNWSRIAQPFHWGALNGAKLDFEALLTQAMPRID